MPPFAGFEDFAACVAAMKQKGRGDEAARKICGRLKAEHEAVEKAKDDVMGAQDVETVEQPNPEIDRTRQPGGFLVIATSDQDLPVVKRTCERFGAARDLADDLIEQQYDSIEIGEGVGFLGDDAVYEPVWVHKAVWTTAYVNDLSDGSFLYIAPGGKKDDEGKTVPRSLRYFPYKDKAGKIDLPHLRNAIARIPQSKAPGLSAEGKKKLQAKARKLLFGASKKSIEPDAPVVPDGPVALPLDKIIVVKTIPIEELDDPAAPEEHFVLGIVLEPDVVDAQKDTYDAPTIRKSAHLFMEEFGTLGLQHKVNAGDKMRILETYLAPVDFQVGDQAVKKGTWLLGVRVKDEELWQAIKSGEMTGWSIGGHAIREPAVEGG